jgi:taurine dehydrogenase small subunit
MKGTTMTTTLEKTLTAADLSDLFEAFNRHDIDGVMRHFCNDAVFFTVAGPEAHGTRLEGRDTIAASFVAVWTNMPDARWDHHSHFVHGDRAVSEWTFSGTDENGMRTEAQGADLFTLRDGKIAVKQALRKARPPFKA